MIAKAKQKHNGQIFQIVVLDLKTIANGFQSQKNPFYLILHFSKINTINFRIWLKRLTMRILEHHQTLTTRYLFCQKKIHHIYFTFIIFCMMTTFRSLFLQNFFFFSQKNITCFSIYQ